MATQATKQTTVAPQGTGATNPFLALAGVNGTTGVNPFMYNPKTTNETSFAQTAPQDVEALVNATFQQLVGRNATAQEIQTYGQELLAAERSNAGLYHQELSYDPTTGKAMTAQGTQVTSGIDAGSFLQNLISGSANAQSYKMATGYFDAMTQALQQQVSE
jgi:hypothetical protein